ncbi:OsmC family protein [Microbacterium betulae]|uniref:OsmC family protein n=1 Tax=Microbacterium betulae TaxID=2981139 RepID=A0AA97FIX8_9MICO|nr:OsmC family protein [Microbacterium sp. AB]WOF23509.1 OsmC family protein [Microbacterium sp. AB]
MGARYRTEAANHDGVEGWSRVGDGLGVRVASPLAGGADPEATNPEQLLALAWATCLNATAQTVVAGRRRTSVRVTVELHDAVPGPGYEFHVDAYLSAEGSTPAETERLLGAVDARCPVSKLLHGAATARVHGEPYAVS